MKFKSEQDLRAWLRKKFERVWWIENKRGGTFGLPDCFVVCRGRAVFLELKLARLRKGTGWVIDLAPAQRLAFLELRRAGVEVWIVAALQGTSEIGALGRIDGLVAAGRTQGRRLPYAVKDWCLKGSASTGLEWLGLGA